MRWLRPRPFVQTALTQSIWKLNVRYMGRGPTIQGRKNATDAKRTATNAKLARELTVISKSVNGDRDNMRLASVITKAKSANMPKDKIDAAIKRGVDGKDGANVEEVLYEASGPAGSAFMIETLTDNRKRTAPALRSILGKYNGSLGTTGSVAWNFQRKGYIEIDLASSNKDEDELMELALEAGADDLEVRDAVAQVTCDPSDLASVRQSLLDADLEPSIAELIYDANDYLDLDASTKETFQKLVDALNDNEDVNQLHHNVNE